jgi:hypothetical protein
MPVLARNFSGREQLDRAALAPLSTTSANLPATAASSPRPGQAEPAKGLKAPGPQFRSPAGGPRRRRPRTGTRPTRPSSDRLKLAVDRCTFAAWVAPTVRTAARAARAPAPGGRPVPAPRHRQDRAFGTRHRRTAARRGRASGTADRLAPHRSGRRMIRRAEPGRERGGQPACDRHPLRQQARTGVLQIPDARHRQNECVEPVARSLP